MPTSSNRRPSGAAAAAPRARRGRPTGDHEAKRAALLKAATSVIAQDGFANTSLRKVAKRAECTTGTVTYYFANKEALVTALVESRFDSYDAMLDASKSEVDVKALFQRWLAHTTDDPEFWLVMFELLAYARHEPAFADIIERRYARYREVLASVLARGQRQGTIRKDIPANVLADQISAIGDGWMMMFPIEPERFTPKRVQTLLDAAITLISPPDATPSKRSGDKRP